MHTQTHSPLVVPTPDQNLGITWWNNLTELHRAYWLACSRTDIPAVAWANYKRARADEYLLLLSMATKTVAVCLAAPASGPVESIPGELA